MDYLFSSAVLGTQIKSHLCKHLLTLTLKLSSTRKMYLIYMEKHVENALHISQDHGRAVTCLVIHEFGILQAKEWHPTSHDEDTILQPSRADVILLP